MNDLTQHFRFVPGFDKRHADPKKNYGISGGRMLFLVAGPKGAVDFVVGTPFYPASALAHLRNFSESRGNDLADLLKPSGWQVFYHSPTPCFDGQTMSTDNCEWLGGKPCYSDGSFLRAEAWLALFLEKGTDWLWPHMEAEYRNRFENGPEVDP